MTALEGRLDFGDPLPGFGPPLMVHAPASAYKMLPPIAGTRTVGAVLTTYAPKSARKAVRALRRAAPGTSVLIDAEQYAGPKRRRGAHPVSRAWVDFQHDLGMLWALTDSPYIPAGDRHALHDTLTQPAAFGPGVIAALPLAHQWITHDVDVLIEEIEKAGIPVALMLEHEKDPLSSTTAVTGLLRVLDCPVKVLLLRSDVAAIGALAHGAAAAAIGS